MPTFRKITVTLYHHHATEGCCVRCIYQEGGTSNCILYFTLFFFMATPYESRSFMRKHFQQMSLLHLRNNPAIMLHRPRIKIIMKPHQVVGHLHVKLTLIIVITLVNNNPKIIWHNTVILLCNYSSIITIPSNAVEYYSQYRLFECSITFS